MWQVVSNFCGHMMTGGDKRTFEFALMKPWQPLLLAAIYVLFVKRILPKFMDNRNAYKLNKVIIVYNAIQVALSFHLFIEGLAIWGDIRNWVRCVPTPESSSPEIIRVIEKHHLYYISKYIEWLDTIFFVLRKKYNQVSFLHVYHHASMPFFSCVSLRFAPASSITIIGFLNSFIHVIMYSYYLIAAMGPHMQKYLTWKKYLTSLQLIQFVLMFLHHLIVAFSDKQCNIPNFLMVSNFVAIFTNVVLFTFFFNREYIRKNEAKKN